jgi:hypothetical protein
MQVREASFASSAEAAFTLSFIIVWVTVLWVRGKSYTKHEYSWMLIAIVGHNSAYGSETMCCIH